MAEGTYEDDVQHLRDWLKTLIRRTTALRYISTGVGDSLSGTSSGSAPPSRRQIPPGLMQIIDADRALRDDLRTLLRLLDVGVERKSLRAEFVKRVRHGRERQKNPGLGA